jgi:hypothetical protein
MTEKKKANAETMKHSITTKVSNQLIITEIRGTCPKCGGSLCLIPQVCAWNADGSRSVEDTFLTPYCQACKLFWIGEPKQ